MSEIEREMKESVGRLTHVQFLEKQTDISFSLITVFVHGCVVQSTQLLGFCVIIPASLGAVSTWNIY